MENEQVISNSNFRKFTQSSLIYAFISIFTIILFVPVSSNAEENTQYQSDSSSLKVDKERLALALSMDALPMVILLAGGYYCSTEDGASAEVDCLAGMTEAGMYLIPIWALFPDAISGASGSKMIFSLIAKYGVSLVLSYSAAMSTMGCALSDEYKSEDECDKNMIGPIKGWIIIEGDVVSLLHC